MKYSLICTHNNIKEDTRNLIKECETYTDKVIILIDKKQDTRGYEYMHCKNQGYDIGKVYQRLQLNKLTDKDELCITNDTISPIKSFKSLFKFCQSKDLDFAGATSSYTDNNLQIVVDGRHIQSFFLYIKKKALLSYQDYYKRIGLVKGKRDTVEKYELGVSSYLKILGYKCKAYIEAEDIMKKYEQTRYDPIVFIKTGQQIIQKGGERNGTFAYPNLYIQEGLPFVKNTMYQYGFKPNLIQHLSNIIYNETKSNKTKNRGNKEIGKKQ